MSTKNILRKSKIKIDGIFYEVDVYKKCPYCGDYVTPQYKTTSAITFARNKKAFLSTFSVECCEKNVLTLHLYDLENKNIDFLYSYPTLSLEQLPDSISKISDRAAKIYQQANRAFYNNDFDLATIGYRTFVEILAKDFLIEEQGVSISKVKTLKLAKTLEMLEDIKLLYTGDVVRYLGNDKTHYEQKYTHHSIDILKKYLNAFIDTIDAKYFSNHPPEDLKRHSK